MTENSEESLPSKFHDSKWWKVEDVQMLNPEDGEFEETRMAIVSVENGFENLNEKVKSQLDDVEDEDNIDDLGESLLLYYLTANALLERHSIEFLAQSHAGEANENYESLKSFFDDELNQSKRESLLHAAGLIDDGLKGEMARTRQMRNKLAHNPEKGLTLTRGSQKMEADIDRAYRAVNRLEDLWRDCTFPDYDG